MSARKRNDQETLIALNHELRVANDWGRSLDAKTDRVMLLAFALGAIVLGAVSGRLNLKLAVFFVPVGMVCVLSYLCLQAKHIMIWGGYKKYLSHVVNECLGARHLQWEEIVSKHFNRGYLKDWPMFLPYALVTILAWAYCIRQAWMSLDCLLWSAFVILNLVLLVTLILIVRQLFSLNDSYRHAYDDCLIRLGGDAARRIRAFNQTRNGGLKLK